MGPTCCGVRVHIDPCPPPLPIPTNTRIHTRTDVRNGPRLPARRLPAGAPTGVAVFWLREVPLRTCTYICKLYIYVCVDISSTDLDGCRLQLPPARPQIKPNTPPGRHRRGHPAPDPLPPVGAVRPGFGGRDVPRFFFKLKLYIVYVCVYISE